MAINLDETPEDLLPDMKIFKYYAGKWQEASLSIPQEMSLDIYVNEQMFVSIHCTPSKLQFLVLGYLFGEGIITSTDDINILRICEESTLADVRLRRKDFCLPQKRTVTSGCGGGVSFNNSQLGPKINSATTISPEQLLSLMQKMIQLAELYRETGGIHTSALGDNNNILVVGEDIGRHNTIDKIVGECLFRGINTKDKILLATGRITSEMVRKAVKMEIPIIASLTSPTEKALLMARELDVTLVGYVRRNNLTVYTMPKRLYSC